MKIHVILLILASALGCGAGTTGTTFTNAGVYIAFAGWRPGSKVGFVPADQLRSTDKLFWRAFCNTGLVHLNYPDRQYGMRVRMVGPDGKPVRKTSLGKALGERFDLLTDYKDSKCGVTEAEGPLARGEFTGPMIAAPAEMFHMRAPGSYTLEIEMQIFRVNRSSGQWTRDLLRFPPAAVKVEKTDLGNG